MVQDSRSDGARFGAWAAAAALAASVGYGVPQILQAAGVLTDPWDRILIFAPSLALAPAFVATLAAAHVAAPRTRRAWSLAALGFAIMYATLVSSVYVIQLGVVIPRDLAGTAAGFGLLRCCGPAMPLTAVDLLGYTLMSLSTLLLAPAAPGGRWTRGTLLANGLLAPVLIGQLAWPWLIWAGAIWLVTFPAAMLLLALAFRRQALDHQHPS